MGEAAPHETPFDVGVWGLAVANTAVAVASSFYRNYERKGQFDGGVMLAPPRPASIPLPGMVHAYHPRLHTIRLDTDEAPSPTSPPADLQAALMADPDNIEAKALLHARSQTIDKVRCRRFSYIAMTR